eukprot:m.476270 g.476270  ORF g.476270 m.476270 type:complete len:135 (-) comp20484_c0_seq1:34-438(-)
MVFKRYVEIGRVVLINSGPDAGKTAVIVDVIDQNRALIDGPNSNVARRAANFKTLSLTDLTIKVPASAGSTAVAKAWKAADVTTKWEQTAWAKKLATRAKRANLNDFERFVVKINKQKRSRIVKSELKKLKGSK